MPHFPDRRVEAVAAFVRERRAADRGHLLQAVLARWPGLTGDELQHALDMAGSGSATRIEYEYDEPRGPVCGPDRAWT